MQRRTFLSAATIPVLAGCIGRDPDKPRGKATPAVELDPYRKQFIDPISRRRTEALLQGDETAWLADLDPSKPELIKQETWRFRNLQHLGLTEVDLRIEAGGENLNTTAQIPHIPQEPDSSLHWVTLLMRPKANEALSCTKLRYTFSWSHELDDLGRVVPKPEDRGLITEVWNVGAESPERVRKTDGPEWDTPWDRGPLRAARSGDVTVLSAEGSPWDPADYVELAAKASRHVGKIWGKRRRPKGFLIFLGDKAQAEEWFAVGDIGDNYSGYTIFPYVVEPDGQKAFIRPMEPGASLSDEQRSAGARIVIRMDKVKDSTAFSKVATHEIAHAVSQFLVDPTGEPMHGRKGEWSQPTWAIEGFAEWVERIAEPSDISETLAIARRDRSRFGGETMPGNKDFYAEDERRLTFNYQYSGSFFYAAASVAGPQKTVSLYLDCLSQSQTLADSELFLNPVLSRQGIDPDRFWSTWQGMVA